MLSALASKPDPTTTAFLTPSIVQGTQGETIPVDLNVTNVQTLFSFQSGLLWSNPTAVACLNVTEGSMWKSIPAAHLQAFPGSIDNTTGVVSFYTWGCLGAKYNLNGSGTLMVIYFYMLQTGSSDIHINDCIMTNNQVNPIIFNTIDYFTATGGGKNYLVEIEGNPQERAGFNGGYSNQSVTHVTLSGAEAAYHGMMIFNVTSDDGATSSAFFNVTIPNNLMNCSTASEWMVLLDGALQSSRTVTVGASSTTIYLPFTYYDVSTEPTQMVTILSYNTAVPEFASTFASMLLATLLVLATFAAALFSVSTRARKRKD